MTIMSHIKLAGFAIAISLLTLGPVQAKNVKVSDQLTIHYETAGSGPTTILFVPGWAMSTKVFEHQLAAFKDSKDYTFVTYDPRGQGQSSKTQQGHYYQQHGMSIRLFLCNPIHRYLRKLQPQVLR